MTEPLEERRPAWTPRLKPTGTTWTTVPLDETFRRVSILLRLLLALAVAVAIGRILLDLWGISVATDGDPGFTSTYDDRDGVLDVLTVVVLALTGTVWMWWQYLLARSAVSGELTRSPGWHAFAWITPVVGLWWPYQNVRDLWWRRSSGWGAATVGWWWASWIAALLIDRMVTAAQNNVESMRDFQDLLVLEAASAFAGLIAGLLAFGIVSRLSEPSDSNDQDVRDSAA